MKKVINIIYLKYLLDTIKLINIDRNILQIVIIENISNFYKSQN